MNQTARTNKAPNGSGSERSGEAAGAAGLVTANSTSNVGGGMVTMSRTGSKPSERSWRPTHEWSKELRGHPRRRTETRCAATYIINEQGIRAMPNKHDIAVAIYPTHQSAEAAVQELQRSGIDMKSLSLVGRDYHTEEHVVGYYNHGDRMKAWGKRGAFWGGLWGSIFGSAFFFIPGIGPIVLAGPIVSWLLGALEGAVVVGGLSVLGAALYNIGIPKDSVLKYESALKADQFIVTVHGSAADVDRARSILQRTEASETAVHAA